MVLATSYWYLSLQQKQPKMEMNMQDILQEILDNSFAREPKEIDNAISKVTSDFAPWGTGADAE
jgi:hypothetical protein